MAQAIRLLDNLSVASPCKASWENMTGNERVRFCHHCEQKVYDVSKMSAEEAEAFLARAFNNHDSVCVRFYRRKDGTVLTRDCPVGLRALRRRLLALGAVAATFLTFIISCVVTADRPGSRLRQVEPFATVFGWFDPKPTMMMGCPSPTLKLAPPSTSKHLVDK